MKKNIFWAGFQAVLPIITGVIPFGAVMGSVAANAGLSFNQNFLMNIFVFAGAAQLAALELMVSGGAMITVVLTALIVNSRFFLYSAALSPTLEKSRLITKLFCAHMITDQNYAVMTAHQSRLHSNDESVRFYLGASLGMASAWILSVLGGFAFGNFAPKSWSLDFAVPLSFIALLLPTLKDRRHYIVAAISAALSLGLYTMPYRLGLIVTAVIGISIGAFWTLNSRRVG